MVGPGVFYGEAGHGYVRVALTGTDERIDADLEHVREHMKIRIRNDRHALDIVALAFQERRRIALHRVGHQTSEDLEQLGHSRSRFR